MNVTKAPSDAIRLEPRRIELSRGGCTTVHLHAAVTADQTFTLSVPRDRDPRFVLRSLHVTDSRGGSPQVTFAAPSGNVPTRQHATPIGPLLSHAAERRAGGSDKGSTTACNLVANARRLDDAAAHGDVLALENGMLTTTRGPDGLSHSCTGPSSVALPVFDKVALQQLLPHTVPGPTMPVLVHARGTGNGLLDVSYQTLSPNRPAFHVRYAVEPPADSGAGPPYDWRGAVARGSVTLFNPLPFSLRGVDFELLDPPHIQYSDRLSYEPAVDVEAGAGAGVLAPAGDAAKDSDNSSVSSDGSTISSIFSVAIPWYERSRDVVHYAVRNVTLDAGQGMSAEVASTIVDVRSVEIFLEEWDASNSLIAICNRTTRTLSKALWEIPPTPGRTRIEGPILRLDAGMEWYIGAPLLGVHAHRAFSLGPQSEIARSVCGGTLHALRKHTRTATFNIRNFKLYEQSCTVSLKAQSPEFDDDLETVLYDEERAEVTGRVKKLPMSRKHHFLNVQVGPGQRLCLVVKQTFFQNRSYMLESELDGKVVDRLARGGTPEAFLCPLRNVAKVRERLLVLKQKRVECSRRFEAAKREIVSTAERFTDTEEKSGEEDDQKVGGSNGAAFAAELEKAKEKMKMWAGELENTASEIMIAEDEAQRAVDGLDDLQLD